MKRRTLLTYNPNAGLADLAGAAGRGFSRAGNQIINLGDNFQKQNNYDAEIAALEKEKKANIAAQAGYNTIVNPNQSTAFKAGYKGDGDASEALGRVKLSAPANKAGFTLKPGETRFGADGKQLVKLDKAPVIKETKKTVVDNDDFIHVVFKDGSTKKTSIKSKDYWQSKGNSNSKDALPNGFVYGNTLKINPRYDDDLYFQLVEAGALRDTPKGIIVNKSKYDNFMNLGEKNIELKH